MATKFVLVRLIEDPTVTRELAEKSLPIWSHQWERVPDDEIPEPSTKARRRPAKPSLISTTRVLAEDSSADSTDKSRSRAAETPKE